ncbi:SEL1-like repeat protein [Nitrogeniibacter aestuarii]|uniref:SEL1-like repeat protein n=1 Tax=Nitrogeniibacter aestuarii TaxID=2815343 RepID=UPI001E4F79C7|nr:SEL1-like repeat protein [Nitrogeniibacter aestuarii]
MITIEVISNNNASGFESDSNFFLCIESADSRRIEPLARSPRLFPGWWRIAFAGARVVPQPPSQRGSSEHLNLSLVVDARKAAARLKRVISFALGHPSVKSITHLGLQLRALDTFLSETVSKWTGPGNNPRFCVDLDELYWRDKTETLELIDQFRSDCEHRWEAVQKAMRTTDYAEFNRLILLSDKLLDPGQWKTWSRCFHFQGIEHSYFASTDEPRDVPYEDYFPLKSAEESVLGGGFECFAEDRKWGIRYRSEDGELSVIARPRWDDVRSNAHSGLAWFVVCGQYGLLEVTLEGAREITPPTFDRAFDFEDGLAVVSVDWKLGLLQPDGVWRKEPFADTVGDFHRNVATFRVNQLVGLIHLDGHIILPPTYDHIGDFEDAETTWVVKNDQHGVLKIDGTLLLPIEFDDIDPLDNEAGFILEKNDLSGFADAEGNILIEPHWEGFYALESSRTFRVYNQGVCGVMDAAGRLLIEPAWDNIRPRFRAKELAIVHEPELLPREYIVSRNNKVGLCNETGQIKIPVIHDNLENLAQYPSEPHERDLVLLEKKLDDFESLKGLFDLSRDQQTLEARFEQIRPCVVGEQIFLLTTLPNTSFAKPPVLGIYTRAGHAIAENRYTWIGSPDTTIQSKLSDQVVEVVSNAWTKGESVAALDSKTNEIFLLSADGHCVSRLSFLLDQCARDVPGADYQLGLALRHGDGMARDLICARHWLAKAAGVRLTTPPQAPPKRRGFFARLFTLKPQRPECKITPPLKSTKGSPIAQLELARMLMAGEGGPTHERYARLWLEKAYEQDTPARPEIGTELARMLESGTGGDVDRNRAFTLTQEAEYANALTQLGQYYLEERGGQSDHILAIKHLERDHANGSAGSSYLLASALVEKAETLDKDARIVALSQAHACLENVIDDYSNIELLTKSLAVMADILLDPSYPDSDPLMAQNHLEKGAKLGCQNCIGRLVERIYGNNEHPSYDPQKSHEWKKRWKPD